MAFLLIPDDFAGELRSSALPAVIDFCSFRFAPSKRLVPVMDELSRELDGRVRIYLIDVDERPELARTYGIRSIPTVLIVKNGEVVAASVGVRQKDSYIELLGKY